MRVQLPSGTPAELALAPGDRGRGIVVIPDIAGMRPLFDDLARRFAEEHGWSACVVEPFPGRDDLTDLERRMAAVKDLQDDRLLADLQHAADLLRNRGGCDRVAVMGFCMGGMYTMKAAGTGLFDRAVAFYGMIRVPEQWRGPGHGEPLDALARPGACPTLVIIGGRDVWTPEDDVAALRALPKVEVAFYPEAEHGFIHDPDRPAHRPDDAADAWRRVEAFLAEDARR